MAANLPIIDLDSIRDRKRVHHPWPTHRIEFVVKKIHGSLRYQFGDDIPYDPIRTLKLCGYQVAESDFLGVFPFEGSIREIAAEFDGTNGIVTISRSPSFSTPEQTFTAAHELGHAALHPPMKNHRDRPASWDGNRVRRSDQEREADTFAACFLMPMERILYEYGRRFPLGPFVPTDEFAFALFGTSLYDVRSRLSSRLDCARELAKASQCNGVLFEPLFKRFGVSINAMSIRLIEAGLSSRRASV